MIARDFFVVSEYLLLEERATTAEEYFTSSGTTPIITVPPPPPSPPPPPPHTGLTVIIAGRGIRRVATTTATATAASATPEVAPAPDAPPRVPGPPLGAPHVPALVPFAPAAGPRAPLPAPLGPAPVLGAHRRPCEPQHPPPVAPLGLAVVRPAVRRGRPARAGVPRAVAARELAGPVPPAEALPRGRGVRPRPVADGPGAVDGLGAVPPRARVLVAVGQARGVRLRAAAPAAPVQLAEAEVLASGTLFALGLAPFGEAEVWGEPRRSPRSATHLATPRRAYGGGRGERKV